MPETRRRLTDAAMLSSPAVPIVSADASGLRFEMRGICNVLRRRSSCEIELWRGRVSSLEIMLSLPKARIFFLAENVGSECSDAQSEKGQGRERSRRLSRNVGVSKQAIRDFHNSSIT